MKIKRGQNLIAAAFVGTLAFSTTSGAEDHTTTDLGTLDQETAEKLFPAKPPYSLLRKSQFPHAPLLRRYASAHIALGGRLPALADVRDAVRREWDNARRLEGNAKFHQELLKRYTATIERPKAAEQKRIAEAKVK